MDGSGNVFSSLEGIHTIFEIDISVGNMFWIRGMAGRGYGGCLRHLVDSDLLDETFVKILGGLIVN
jgi:galactokinase